jgi:hypothetical protein
MRDASPGPARRGFTCACCGHFTVTAVDGLFANPRSGSPARFCSPACRAAAWRRRQKPRFACLPTPATLDDSDHDAAPGADPQLINELATCRYLETATNLLLIWPPVVNGLRSHHHRLPRGATFRGGLVVAGLSPGVQRREATPP